jgi:hypothetical protein
MTMLNKALAAVAAGVVLATSAFASDNNTVDIAGLPPGQHKVEIELVDANHNPFPGQVVTVTFTVPGPAD